MILFIHLIGLFTHHSKKLLSHKQIIVSNNYKRVHNISKLQKISA